MKSGTRSKVEGTLHIVKGNVKVMFGKITDNPKLKVKGVAERTTGRVQKKVGQIKTVVGK